MEKLLNKIKELKSAISALNKSDTVTDEMVDNLKNALENLREEGAEVISKDELVKALEDAGFRESALLLKNWDEKDAIATNLEKSKK